MKSFIWKLVFLSIACAGVFFSAKYFTDKSLGVANVTKGQVKYTLNCLLCHGTKGQGDGIAAAAMQLKPNNISEQLQDPLQFKLMLVNSVLKGDEQGKHGLTINAFETKLTKQDINDIFGYLESLQ